MKRLHFATGGRPVSNNDLQILQEELFKSIEQQFAGLGAFIISGCTTSGASTIAPGLVFVDGKILPFAGTSSATYPCCIKQATVQDQDLVAYETGGTHPKRKFYSAELVAAAPGSGEYIVMSSTGGRSYFDAISAEVVRMRGNQTIEGKKTFNSEVFFKDKKIWHYGDFEPGGFLPLKDGYEVVINDDLNNYTKSGHYYANSGALNKPGNINGHLLVIGLDSGHALQIWSNHASADVKFRSKNNGTWGGWATLLTSQATAWQNVAFANGYTGTVQLRKNAEGQLELKGYATMGADYGVNVFTLPSGFRPSAIRWVVAVGYNTNSDTKAVIPVRILTDGQVIPATSDLLAYDRVFFDGLAVNL